MNPDLTRALGTISESVGNLIASDPFLSQVEPPLLRKAVDHIGSKVKGAVVLLGGKKDEKVYLICSVAPELVKSGIDARNIISAAAPEIGGGGGGKADFAQAGGKNADGLAKALEKGKGFMENI